MFIVSLLTITKLQNESKYLSSAEWIKKKSYIHMYVIYVCLYIMRFVYIIIHIIFIYVCNKIMEFYLSIKKIKIMLFAGK